MNFSLFTAEYVKQCSRSDPKLKTCLIDALHHLRPYLSVGIPEIELPSVEPFRVSSHRFRYLPNTLKVNVSCFVNRTTHNDPSLGSNKYFKFY